MKLTVNAVDHEVDVEPEMPLLWVSGHELGITRPKSGCGMAQCVACTVQVEGLGRPDALHAVQKAWIAHQVAQRGYCQSGRHNTAAGASRSDERAVRLMNPMGMALDARTQASRP